jgi:ubiquinone biosynthesis protein UbiJ
MKWYAEQIDALRAENERLVKQVEMLELEREQLWAKLDYLYERMYDE